MASVQSPNSLIYSFLMSKHLMVPYYQNLTLSLVWSYTPLIPALGRQRQGHLYKLEGPLLHSVPKAIQTCLERKPTTQTNKQTNKYLWDPWVKVPATKPAG